MIKNLLPAAAQHDASWGSCLQLLLIEPAVTVDVIVRQQSRLLAVVLLIITILFGMLDTTWSYTTPGYHSPWYGYLFLGTAYVLNRSGAYKVAAHLAVIMVPCVIFPIIVHNPTHGLDTTIQYLVLSYLLASIFVSQRGLIVLAAINMAGLLLLPNLMPLAAPLDPRLVTLFIVNLLGMLLTFIVLRQRDQVEHAQQTELEHRNEQLLQALNAANMGAWTWDLRTDSLTWSIYSAPIFSHVAGGPPESRSAYFDQMPPDDRASVTAAITAALAVHDGTYQVVHRVYESNDSFRWWEVHGRVRHDANAQPLQIISTVIDITERQATARMQAETALAASEQRFRALLDSYADAVALVDQQGFVQYVSPAALQILGYELNTYAGAKSFDFIHPADQQAIADQLAELLSQTKRRLTAEVRIQHQDGSWRWFEATAVNSLADPAIASIVVNLHDATERKAAEAAMRASEERYRVISELVSDYAFAYQVTPEGDTTLEWITDAFTRITGYSVDDIWTPAQLAAIIHPDDRAIASERRRRQLAGQIDISEYRIVAKDGRVLWQRFYDRPVWDAAAGRVIRIYGAVQDITHVKQLEQQLIQTQKMEGIGRLAAGIAHDFNNLLTIILGSAELLLAAQLGTHGAHTDAERIQRAAESAATLTRQLLAFSRQQVLTPRQLDLNAVIQETGQLLRPLIGANIELVTDLAPLGLVLADQGQLEQVLINLAINARDAMPTGGTLTISTALAGKEATNLRPQHWVVGSDCTAVLTIRDTGVGMDPATRAHIFEPFFTTKPFGQGTGLGLATVHGIITQSGGTITVESTLGQGTTFRIYLPCMAPTLPDNHHAIPLVPQNLSGDATVLLVEDEPLLCDVAAEILRGYGYRVLVAHDGPTALAIATTYSGALDLLLTDLLLPGRMNGQQLAEQIGVLRPAINVVFMSGSLENIQSTGTSVPNHLFVQKPFTPDSLARVVWQSLYSGTANRC